VKKQGKLPQEKFLRLGMRRGIFLEWNVKAHRAGGL